MVAHRALNHHSRYSRLFGSEAVAKQLIDKVGVTTKIEFHISEFVRNWRRRARDDWTNQRGLRHQEEITMLISTHAWVFQSLKEGEGAVLLPAVIA
jgi:hypothetical protein